MSTKFVQPQPPRAPTDEKQVVSYLGLLVKYINAEFIRRPPNATLTGSLQLASPNGSVYTVAVSDAGVLETTLVRS